jgi:hypothetical protein
MTIRSIMAAAAMSMVAGCASLKEAGAGLAFALTGPTPDEHGRWVCEGPGGSETSVNFTRANFADLSRMNCKTPPKNSGFEPR